MEHAFGAIKLAPLFLSLSQREPAPTLRQVEWNFEMADRANNCSSYPIYLHQRLAAVCPHKILRTAFRTDKPRVFRDRLHGRLDAVLNIPPQIMRAF